MAPRSAGSTRTRRPTARVLAGFDPQWPVGKTAVGWICAVADTGFNLILDLVCWRIFTVTNPTSLAPMPHTHEPDPTSRTPYLPICPACGKTMRLAQAKPHPHFV